MMRRTIVLVAAMGSSGCYLAHERDVPVPTLDASVVVDAHDAPRPIDTNDAAPFCPPGMPCDCFVGGELIWDHVLYNASDSMTVGGYGQPGEGWGDDMHLEARCAGTYTITARVVARGSGCEVATVQTVTQITSARSGARARMPLWIVNGACANEALTRSGGEACIEIAWSAAGGGTGSTMLGCFAPFGPYCFGGPGCFPGGVIDTGASGDWSF
jgi:hypothetical protein